MAEKKFDSTFWINPDYLKAARQEVPGLSQDGLAKEVGNSALDDDDRPITREIIGNYETRRSLRNNDTALAIYKVLAAKGSPKALRAVRHLLERQKAWHEHRLRELDPQRIERERQAIRGWLEDIEDDLRVTKGLEEEAAARKEKTRA